MQIFCTHPHTCIVLCFSFLLADRVTMMAPSRKNIFPAMLCAILPMIAFCTTADSKSSTSSSQDKVSSFCQKLVSIKESLIPEIIKLIKKVRSFVMIQIRIKVSHLTKCKISVTNLSSLYTPSLSIFPAQFALYDNRRVIKPSDAPFLVMATIINVTEGNFIYFFGS